MSRQTTKTSKKKLNRTRLAIVALAVLTVLAGTVLGGNLDQTLPPTNPNTAMYTLLDIYNRLTTNATAAKRAGAFTEPSSGPTVGTGKTLDEVYAAALPTKLPKTGQTTAYATGDDGALQKGVAWPSPRFTDNGNGTVTDNLTGLIWCKNANIWGWVGWTTALSNCNSLASGTGGLTDGSQAGDWRLPNVRELQSLVDYGRSNPALPSGHPFTGLQSNYYWSSSTYAASTVEEWILNLSDGYVRNGNRALSFYVWPVRGGQ